LVCQEIVMKIPKQEVVKFVVKAVLKKRFANSQGEFKKLVDGELKKVDSGYAISGKRLRTIAVSTPNVKIKVHVKKGRLPKKCPACGSGLRKCWTRNLKGKKILEHVKCPKCGYKGHDGKFTPRKYEFWVGRHQD
jgi:predicted RNA-binding Zn-ribbon protein involved in translation (DUF1610 family)